MFQVYVHIIWVDSRSNLSVMTRREEHLPSLIVQGLESISHQVPSPGVAKERHAKWHLQLKLEPGGAQTCLSEAVLVQATRHPRIAATHLEANHSAACTSCLWGTPTHLLLRILWCRNCISWYFFSISNRPLHHGCLSNSCAHKQYSGSRITEYSEPYLRYSCMKFKKITCSLHWRREERDIRETGYGTYRTFSAMNIFSTYCNHILGKKNCRRWCHIFSKK